MATPCNRIRTVGLGLIAASGACIVALVLSFWVSAGLFLNDRHAIVCGWGRVSLACSSGMPIELMGYARYGNAFVARRIPPPVAPLSPKRGELLFRKSGPIPLIGSWGNIAYYSVPLWLLTLLLLAPGLFLLYLTRNTPGCCTFCRYDLTGLPPDSPCPECGRAPTAKDLTPAIRP